MPEVDGEAISQLPVVTSVADDDLFVVVASGATSGIAASDMPGGGGATDEIASQSIVTGNITAGYSEVKVTDGATNGSDIFYAGNAWMYGGDVEVAAPGMPGGMYLYFYGGRANVYRGNVVISGSHEMAVAHGGRRVIEGGSVTFDPGGADAYSATGGQVIVRGGQCSSLDGTVSYQGGSLSLGGGKGTGPGGLGFFGTNPQPQASGDSSSITAEQIWQKLAAIGLVEDTA